MLSWKEKNLNATLWTRKTIVILWLNNSALEINYNNLGTYQFLKMLFISQSIKIQNDEKQSKTDNFLSQNKVSANVITVLHLSSYPCVFRSVYYIKIK